MWAMSIKGLHQVHYKLEGVKEKAHYLSPALGQLMGPQVTPTQSRCTEGAASLTAFGSIT